MCVGLCLVMCRAVGVGGAGGVLWVHKRLVLGVATPPPPFPHSTTRHAGVHQMAVRRLAQRENVF